MTPTCRPHHQPAILGKMQNLRVGIDANAQSSAFKHNSEWHRHIRRAGQRGGTDAQEQVMHGGVAHTVMAMMSWGLAEAAGSYQR
jgi:hypothetical protein